jgi:hypothetical protein
MFESCRDRQPQRHFVKNSLWLRRNQRSIWIIADSDRRLLSIGLALEELSGRMPPPKL